MGVLWSFPGREEDVDDQAEGVLDELGNDPAEQTAADLQGGVRVDLAQPRFPHRIYQKIQSEYLEIKPPTSPDEPAISDCVADFLFL